MWDCSLKFAKWSCQFFRPGLDFRELGSVKTQINQPAKGRIIKGAAKFAFGGKETFVIVRDEILDSVMFGRISLDNDSSGIVASSGPAGHLAQYLKGSLSGAKSGKFKEWSANSAPTKVTPKTRPLSDHLCADQMSISPFSQRRMISSWEPRFPVVSRSIRVTRACGTSV